ncbi:hypothetical protein ABZW18_01640 [Streptomyces sp. NPDC004647]|uniref:hypothetical protein n=1 Tax=Streptomyces sp. NPDC004647 TaxID=3154671 RepID=UPI0033BE13E4
MISSARNGRRGVPARARVVLAVSVGMIGISGAAIAAAVQSDGPEVIVHEEPHSPEDIREYWTPERMRNAEPVEMPHAPERCGSWRGLFDSAC